LQDNFNLQCLQNVSYNRYVEESKEVNTGAPAPEKKGLDVDALKKSLANVQKNGWPTPEKPPGKVYVPPFVKEVPPFVEDAPQPPLPRTHEEAMKFFHEAQKEHQEIQKHEKAMSFFHKAVNPPQTGQTPAPEASEKKNAIERLFALFSNKTH
jgi:hypothetical protein